MFKFTKFGCSPTFFVEDREKEIIVPFFETTMDGASYRFFRLDKVFDVKCHAYNCMGKIKVTPFDLKTLKYNGLLLYLLNITDIFRDIEFYRKYKAHFTYDHKFSDEQLVSKKAKEIERQPFIVVGKGLVKPEPYKDNRRFTSGHIHLSWEYKGLGEVSPELIVKTLDKVLLPEDRSWLERVENYSTPGAYQLKPYGLEYRSLTNFWLIDPYFLVEGLKKAEEVINKVLEKKGE